MALPSNANLPSYPFPANARSFDFEFFRLVHQALIQHTNAEGIAGASTDLKATTAGSGLTVNVPAGRAFVQGDDRSTQGSYYVYNPTTQAVTATAAHATHPRIDRVVLRVYDADVSGGATQWTVEIIAGTPTAGATLTNLTGAASVPNGALLLANLLVPATFTGPFVDATHLQDRRFGLPIAGRELFSGYSEITSGGAGAGDKGSISIVGDGSTAVHVDMWAACMLTTGAGGTAVTLRLCDAASGGGNVLTLTEIHAAHASYEAPCTAKVRLPAFSGSKSVYANLQNAAGTPQLVVGATYPALLRATWAA